MTESSTHDRAAGPAGGSVTPPAGLPTDLSLEAEAAIRAEAQAWIIRLASGSATEDEVARLHAWLATPAHQAAFTQERALWQGLSALQPTPAVLAAKPRFTRRRAFAAASALAAGVAAVAVAPRLERWLWSAQATRTRIASLTLPDGSLAVLDAESEVALHYSNTERRVALLQGRAWFQVRHGDARPFRVAADGGVTEDIGTAFAVQRENGAVLVAVSEGRVAVSAPEGSIGLRLAAGGRARYRAGGPVELLPPVPVQEIGPWRNGDILLSGATLPRALDEIGRYRAAPVFLLRHPAGTPPISAVFRTDRPDEAIAAVAQMGGLSVLHLPGGVLVLR